MVKKIFGCMLVFTIAAGLYSQDMNKEQKAVLEAIKKVECLEA